MKHPLASSYLMDFPGTSSNNNNSTYPSTNPNYSFPISSPSIFHENNPNCLHHLQDFSHHEQLVPILAHQETARNMEEYYTDQHLPINVLVNGSPGTEVFCYNTRQNIPVKRSSKKDRHSKIHTAHGPKDRRIRLSVDVAHRLFWLQDLLGLDNASKTVDWLLTKSKPAIEQNSLSGGNVATIASSSSNAPLNNSECKILSGIFDECASYSLPRASIAMEEAKSTAKREKKLMSPSGSRAFHLQEKERREGARARARERTKEKRIRLENSNYFDLLSKSSQCIDEMDQNMNRNHCSWSGEEQWSTAQIQLVNDYQPFLHIEEPIHQCISLQDATDNWSPSCFINCHQIASSSHENHLSIHGTSIKGSGIQEIGVDLIDISMVQDY